MQFVLQVRSPTGLRPLISLPQRGSVLVGNSSPANIVLDDFALSSSHFTVDCSDGILSVVDLESTSGILVNGVRLHRSGLQYGDVVCAGRSFVRLSVVLEGRLGKSILAAALDDLEPAQFELTALVGRACNFALLDGAVDPAVLELLKQSGAFFQSLYEGEPAIPIAPYGPFLVDLSTAPEFLSHLIAASWGKSWGMYLKASLSFQELRRHLRTLLLVNLDGEQTLFRFYDPRVLPLFLAVATPDQRTELFGK